MTDQIKQWPWSLVKIRQPKGRKVPQIRTRSQKVLPPGPTRIEEVLMTWQQEVLLALRVVIASILGALVWGGSGNMRGRKRASACSRRWLWARAYLNW